MKRTIIAGRPDPRRRPAAAHDTWVQTNTNLIRTGDAVHIDLMLGQPRQRPPRLQAGEQSRSGGLHAESVTIRTATGLRSASTSSTDIGYTPKEGFWTSKFAADLPRVVPGRAHARQGGQPRQAGAIDQAGQDVFRRQPVARQGAPENPGSTGSSGTRWSWCRRRTPSPRWGREKRSAFASCSRGSRSKMPRVSFIPRGETLASDFDDRFERTTDGDGSARVHSHDRQLLPGRRAPQGRRRNGRGL